MKRFTTALLRLISAIVLTMALISPIAQAAPSGLYLSPTTGNYSFNSTFTSQLRFGGTTGGVRAHFTYDTSKLTITGTSNSGSAFNNPSVSYDNATGSFNASSSSSSSSSDNLVTTITFKGIGSGNANVTFNGTNQRADWLLLVQVWTDTSTTSAVYTIGNPPTPPQSGGSGGQSQGGGAPSQPTGGSGSVSSTPSSPSNSSSSSKNSDTSDSVTITTPSEQKSATKKKSTGNRDESYTTLPTPDDPSVVPQTIEPKTFSVLSYLPVIVTGLLSLLAIGIFAAYRRTHLSASLRNLIATATLSQTSAAGSTAVPLAIKRVHAVIAPKLLLAYKAPKLLASGIKTRLLLTAGTKPTKRP